MRQTFFNQVIAGSAIAPQSMAPGATINGNRIVTPATSCRQLGFIVTAGSLTGVTALAIGVQYSQDGGATWNNVLARDGVTVMRFKPANTIAGSRLDASVAGGGCLMASLDMSRANHGDYRLYATALTGATINLAASYVLYDAMRGPVQDAKNDDFLSQQLVALA